MLGKIVGVGGKPLPHITSVKQYAKEETCAMTRGLSKGICILLCLVLLCGCAMAEGTKDTTFLGYTLAVPESWIDDTRDEEDGSISWYVADGNEPYISWLTIDPVPDDLLLAYEGLGAVKDDMVLLMMSCFSAAENMKFANADGRNILWAEALKTEDDQNHPYVSMAVFAYAGAIFIATTSSEKEDDPQRQAIALGTIKNIVVDEETQAATLDMPRKEAVLHGYLLSIPEKWETMTDENGDPFCFFHLRT